MTAVADAFDSPRAPSVEPKTRTVVVFMQRVNWRRTLAASILLALLESAAFAAAWWWVHPGARGTLVVHTPQAGVDVLIDGTVVGQTPFREELPPGRHQLTLRQGASSRDMPVEISLGVVTTQSIDWPRGPRAATGRIQVASTPTNAEVLVGGVPKGKTPLLLEGLAAGKQQITLRGDAGRVTTAVLVRAGETTSVDVPIFAGWILVHAPVELSLLVNGTKVGSNMDGQILLKPGTHRLEAVSEALGFRERVNVTVEPGKVKHLTISLPTAPLRVQDEPGSEIYVDGERLGALPGEMQVPVGTHEVLIRRPDGTERRQTVTVRTSGTVIVG